MKANHHRLDDMMDFSDSEAAFLGEGDAGEEFEDLLADLGEQERHHIANVYFPLSLDGLMLLIVCQRELFYKVDVPDFVDLQGALAKHEAKELTASGRPSLIASDSDSDLSGSTWRSSAYGSPI